MLTHLTIKNYALIEHLELDFAPHLNVITGETGAGKSILLGAVGLLLGNRADTKVLWNDTEKCVAEGIFDIRLYRLKKWFTEHELDYADQTVLRREISPAGKSRAFINDTPVTLDVLKQLGLRLVDVHSQHETLALGDRLFQLHVVDTYANNTRERDAYADQWEKTAALRQSFGRLQTEAETLRQEADFISFQLNELQEAQLQPGELETLETQTAVLENANDIKSRLLAASQWMTGNELALDKALSEIRSQLQGIAHLKPAYQELYNRVESIRIELGDLQREVEREEESVEADPTRLEDMQARISLLYQLQQKHRKNTVEELIALRQSLEERANQALNLDDDLARLKKQLAAAEETLKKRAQALSETRANTLKPLCRQLTDLARALGMPDAVLKAEHLVREASAHGIDVIDFLFSANKGITPRALQQVASGGEFSRLMFCVKYVLAEKTAIPTLLLDEIDSGISGEVAVQMAKLMQAMASAHQLITITHLPQLAAKGHAHYFVYKENTPTKTVSRIKLLTKHERVEEIAKMIAGENPSARALASARELMGA